jgi:hypothetical protein
VAEPYRFTKWFSSGARRKEQPTAYVLTAHRFNHLSRGVPIDPRLLARPDETVFYFVEPEGVPADFSAPALAEAEIFPEIGEAGKRHLAEWSFLLAEYYRPFARYPFYMVSSRFYEKNERLPGALHDYSAEWFRRLRQYGYGYWPSYNRQLGFEDLCEYFRLGRLGMKQEGLDLLERLYGVKFLAEYRWFSDFFCNYLGFQSRAHFEAYVEFYLPLFELFFDRQWRPTDDYEKYVRRRDVFRAEKPFTLLLELASHLFFYVRDVPFFGLHYDGFYAVDERRTRLARLSALPTIRCAA